MQIRRGKADRLAPVRINSNGIAAGSAYPRSAFAWRKYSFT